MKYTSAVCMAVLLLSGEAMAQEGPKVQLLGGGGFALPVTPDAFKDGWKEGYDLAGGAAVRLTNNLSIRGLVSYDRFRFDRDGLLSSVAEEIGFDPSVLGFVIGIDGADAEILSLSGELEYAFVGGTDRISPYVFGGGGAARLSVGDARLSVDLPFVGRIEETLEGMSETSAMASFGGGVNIPASDSFAIFVEGRYQIMFTEGDTTGHAVMRAGVRVGL